VAVTGHLRDRTLIINTPVASAVKASVFVIGVGERERRATVRCAAPFVQTRAPCDP